MSEELDAYETEKQAVSFEDAIKMYEQRLQDQTAIIFGLLAKLGGAATLTAKDFLNSEHYNTVLASNNEDGDVFLRIAKEDVETEEDA
jgi:hypothetical protein